MFAVLLPVHPLTYLLTRSLWPVLWLVALAVLLALVIARPRIAATARRHPLTARYVLALWLVLVPVLAAIADDGDVYLQTCSSKFIDQACGVGESWCRTLLELECWLAGFGIL